MDLLLDTHSFLWFIGGNRHLSEKAKDAICNIDNNVFLSIASLWEMAIKINIQKLKLPYPFERLVPEQLLSNEIEVLSIKLPHLIRYSNLSLHHRDPFDRLIICQAKTEDLRIVGKDSEFEKYDVELLW